ncbi:MAG: hypothetical protein A2W61_08085 [Deltaproteobacteria bacterium RIFCSPLOWO2_01_44_7]|nr:MAG: hypothetical protein A2712_10465 [Deltaproteobacteria bacterium RIFCSPHIGHO2_01_FULL_43_49]OGQ15530.1 MAG: hypothetical protein A3D22_10995 [Deltaproteobacteria bacterium RIFCSPHIGHO2_02_FULL_44_53]OGQ28472.1 MAG: hypothetical protein A3D98_03180 [Deltaproteobacteria bacterium RIFCSPHIGHO2_12_FULL_44_21]OGQ32336.1 MAG: hypothetical protein A2979_00840 [Deltaproteobacteria bacterium RIFCSPLOWO2_01_FULL_45_74]OGQ37698.1 MAG: hypothetical protein A2W61_08085 [Deltaproteobacteria bacterium 
MNQKKFKKLFEEHRDKILEAWNKISDNDMRFIDGDIEKFLEKTSKLYQIPREIILRELDAVQKNIDEGIETDFASRLDPTE